MLSPRPPCAVTDGVAGRGRVGPPPSVTSTVSRPSVSKDQPRVCRGRRRDPGGTGAGRGELRPPAARFHRAPARTRGGRLRARLTSLPPLVSASPRGRACRQELLSSSERISTASSTTGSGTSCSYSSVRSLLRASRNARQDHGERPWSTTSAPPAPPSTPPPRPPSPHATEWMPLGLDRKQANRDLLPHLARSAKDAYASTRSGA